MLPKRSSRGTQILTRRSQSALGFRELPLSRLEMVISTYSNILLSVSIINITDMACERAAENGHLDCLKYLHETAKAPWDKEAVRYAHENKHPECLQYCLDNDCPLPEGWSYEDGELHVPDNSESESESESELESES